jgi:hypothetical protein
MNRTWDCVAPDGHAPKVPALISEIERRPEAILFHDKMTTALTVPGAASRN